MVRTVKGITLTPEERRKAGYEKETIKTHTCSVTLPNGVSCAVTYTRWSTSSHGFAFEQPLNRTQYVNSPIANGIPGIEAKAATLVETLFQQAQQQEQKSMQQKSAGRATTRRHDDGPQMSAINAERLAGLYAPCVKCRSGTLIRVGGTYGTPEGAHREIETGRHSKIRLLNEQQLVVGICNRAAQCWQVPTFLTTPQSNENAAPAGIDDLEEDEEPNIALGHPDDDGEEEDQDEYDEADDTPDAALF